MSDECRAERRRGIRIVSIAIFSIILTFVLYSTNTSLSESNNIIQRLYPLAQAVLILTFSSLGFAGYGAYLIIHSELKSDKPESVLKLIAKILQVPYYQKIFIIASLSYGIFFSFISQIIIYNQNVTDISNHFPSLILTVCCNLPGYVPMVTIQLSPQFSILIIPINVILAVIVSVLVGINAALNVYALKVLVSKPQRKISTMSTVGAFTGLFVGCPTCAGSIFSALIGFSAGTAISVLSPFQSIFIAISIPILIITPYIMIKTINKGQTCRL